MNKLNVGYLRVSTEAQTEKYGLDLQKQKIIERANKDGATIDRWYIDGGYSGSKIDRPDIQRLMEDVEFGIVKSVYVYKLDRMSRDTIDALTLLCRTLPKYGVKLISATEELRIDTPSDKFLTSVTAVVGQYERELIYMRTRAGMVERVKKGLWMGGGRIPYGYYYDRNDGILHVKIGESEKVIEAYELYLKGYSCQRISNLLDLTSDNHVRKILTNEVYIGRISYRGKLYKGLHEPIVSEKMFNSVHDFMKKRSSNSYIGNKFMLSGLCYCGKCGARMRYKKWGKRHVMECYSHEKEKKYMVRDINCKNLRMNVETVEQEVSDCFRRFAVNVKAEEKRENKKSVLEKEIKKTVDKLKKLYALYAESDTDTLLSVIQEEEKRQKSLKIELEETIRRESTDISMKVEKIQKISAVWDSLTPKEQNKILKECVEKVVITDGDIDIHFNIS